MLESLVVSRLATPSVTLTKTGCFAIVQLRRTARAIEELREFSEHTTNLVFKYHPEERPKDQRTDQQLMALSLKMALRLKEYVSDLKAIVFRNGTDIDFIISDNPLVLTNRFSFQRLRESAFGLSNSGAILAMPITPKMCLVWYDRGVYNVPNASGTPFVDVKSGEDAASINEWQYLHAQEILYFFRWKGPCIHSGTGGKVRRQPARVEARNGPICERLQRPGRKLSARDGSGRSGSERVTYFGEAGASRAVEVAVSD
jgi:Protein of unknown function (DUF4238)